MSASQRVLQRTFSTNPGADSLKRAIKNGEIDKVRQRIGLLPIGLDYQYAYLALASSKEVCTILLHAMDGYWHERLEKAPQDTLETLVAGLKRLSQSFSVDSLDFQFRSMLGKIRRVALNLPAVAKSAAGSQLARSIPECADDGSLQMNAAYEAAFQPHEQAHGDLMELIERARHRIEIAPPLQNSTPPE